MSSHSDLNGRRHFLFKVEIVTILSLVHHVLYSHAPTELHIHVQKGSDKVPRLSISQNVLHVRWLGIQNFDVEKSKKATVKLVPCF